MWGIEPIMLHASHRWQAAFDDGLRIMQAGEPMKVQTALSELAIKALYKSILGRLSRLDKVQRNPSLSGPEVHGFGG